MDPFSSVPDERDSAHRKHHLDYTVRPGSDGSGKNREYIYTGYYYALKITAPGLSFRKLTYLFLLLPFVQLVMLLSAGLLVSSINNMTWTALPYVFSLIAAAWAWLGAWRLFIQRGNEFVRRVRDKGVYPLKYGQMVLFISSLVSFGAEIVNLVGDTAINIGQSVAFAVMQAACAACCALLVWAIRSNPVYIYRDGMDELNNYR